MKNYLSKCLAFYVFPWTTFRAMIPDEGIVVWNAGNVIFSSFPNYTIEHNFSLYWAIL